MLKKIPRLLFAVATAFSLVFPVAPDALAQGNSNPVADSPLILEIKRLSRGEARDDSEILRLIDGGADVSRPSPNGVPALHWAATFGQVRVVRRLVEAGADVNRRNPNGDGTAAHLAALLRNTEMLAALVELGADLSLRNGDGNAPLCHPTLSAEQREGLVFALTNSADNEADMPRLLTHALNACDE